MITKNHECYVSLEVAKLLKQAGFDWPCNHAICCDSTHYPNLKEGDVLEYNHLECSELMEGKKPHMLLCPTLAVAQRWLRKVKRIFISVSVYAVIEQGLEITDSDKFSVYAETWNSQSEFWNKWTSLFEIDDFNTYEEAQEAGIKKCLTDLLHESN